MWGRHYAVWLTKIPVVSCLSWLALQLRRFKNIKYLAYTLITTWTIGFVDSTMFACIKMIQYNTYSIDVYLFVVLLYIYIHTCALLANSGCIVLWGSGRHEWNKNSSTNTSSIVVTLAKSAILNRFGRHKLVLMRHEDPSLVYTVETVEKNGSRFVWEKAMSSLSPAFYYIYLYSAQKLRSSRNDLTSPERLLERKNPDNVNEINRSSFELA